MKARLPAGSLKLESSSWVIDPDAARASADENARRQTAHSKRRYWALESAKYRDVCGGYRYRKLSAPYGRAVSNLLTRRCAGAVSVVRGNNALQRRRKRRARVTQWRMGAAIVKSAIALPA